MPHFQIVTHKHLNAEKWTNVYFVSAGSLDLASAVATNVMNIEGDVHKNVVTIDYALVSEREQPFRNYRRVNHAATGDVTPTTGAKPMPLWNVVRCEFQPSNSGKPDVKNLRLPVYSDEVQDILTYTNTFKLFILDNYASAISLLDGIEDDQGNAWTDALVRAEIFDRDLSRHKRRRVVTP